MKPTLLFLALLCLTACSRPYPTAEFTERVTNRGAPPGCAIVCDDNGHYGVRFPGGYIPPIAKPSRQEAIDLAWEIMVGMKRPRKPEFNWKERCE